MPEQSREHTGLPSQKPSKTRRELLAGQAKALLALGTTVLTTTMANAAPRPPCFLRGTRICLIDGERNVENIAIGDQVVTAGGRSRQVVWVGKWEAQKPTARAWSRHIRPVRIKRSALAPNVPYEDILVSQGHAIFIDGVLIPAGELVNGSTIVLDAADEVDLLEYFHLRLASHDVILAAGAPAETLLQHPAIAADLDQARHVQREPYCAPVICKTRSGVLWSRARRAATPLLGPQKLDIIRRRLAHLPT